MADKAEAPGRRTLTWLWMILALLSVGGFLTWLGYTAEPTDVQIVRDEEPEEDLAIPTIPKQRLAQNKDEYAGQEIRVRDIAATGQLGPNVFWFELGDQSNQIPLLVRFDTAANRIAEPRTGGVFTLVGRLAPMNDSIAAAWNEAGAFNDDGGELQASFTDYYMHTTEVRRGTASAPPAGAVDTSAAADTSAVAADTAGQ